MSGKFSAKAAVVVVGLAVAAGAGAAAPAAAEIYSLAAEQRMASLHVTPREVAEVRASVPRIASFLNNVWTVATRQAGVPYAPPSLGAYTESFQHAACGRVSVDNAAYCPAGNIVLYDPIFLAALAKTVGGGNVAEGWFSVVVVVAHEWGHAIVLQTQRGVFRSRRMHEFAADCLAGAVARLAFDSRAINHRDLNGAYRTLSMLGDKVSTEQNAANMRAGHGHGIGPDRQTAFQYGFDNGPGRCMAATASR
ncbi:MAG: neutral zinc metallopeptidase [Alphaproteobacteria bacterium]|nr:neutral zinc metallopeptidase [Alphaproteobacteria bacterium]